MQFRNIAKHILVNAVHSSWSPVVFSQQPFQTSLLEPLEELQFLVLWHWLQFQPQGLLMGRISVTTQVSVLIYCCMVWILLPIHILKTHWRLSLANLVCRPGYCKSSDCSLHCEILKDHVKSYKGLHNNFIVFRLVICRKDKSLSQTQKRLGLESVGSISKSAEQKGKVFMFTLL